MVTRNAAASRYFHLYQGVHPFHFEEEKPYFSKVKLGYSAGFRAPYGENVVIPRDGEVVLATPTRKFFPNIRHINSSRN